MNGRHGELAVRSAVLAKESGWAEWSLGAVELLLRVLLEGESKQALV